MRVTFVYERCRAVLRGAPLLVAEGRLQREGEGMSVLVERAWSQTLASAGSNDS